MATTTTTAPLIVEGTVTRQLGPFAVAIVGGVQWLLGDNTSRLTPGTSIEVVITSGNQHRVYTDGSMALIEGIGLIYTSPRDFLPRMVDVTIRPTTQDDEDDFGEGHRNQVVLDSTALFPIKQR